MYWDFELNHISQCETLTDFSVPKFLSLTTLSVLVTFDFVQILCADEFEFARKLSLYWDFEPNQIIQLSLY